MRTNGDTPGDRWCQTSSVDSTPTLHKGDPDCYEAYMSRLGFPVNQRFFGNVCLFTKFDRINMHDWRWVRGMRNKDFLPGDFLFHTDPGKKKHLAAGIADGIKC